MSSASYCLLFLIDMQIQSHMVHFMHAYIFPELDSYIFTNIFFNQLELTLHSDMSNTSMLISPVRGFGGMIRRRIVQVLNLTVMLDALTLPPAAAAVPYSQRTPLRLQV